MGMDRSEQFTQGYRSAAKDAVQWLHERAASMNDPHAVQVLNSAATNLGWDIKRADRIPTASSIPEERGTET
jgi:hypothetical protein